MNTAAELTNLTEAQVLYVSGNSLSGTLPEQLGKMADLRFVNASDNSISGTLPPSVGALRALHDLSLYVNEISGSVPQELGDVSEERTSLKRTLPSFVCTTEFEWPICRT